MLRLVINADDFGLTNGVNRAVMNLAECQAISSTSVMVNGAYSEEASRLLEFPFLGVGLHFNLTEGYPVLNPSRVGSLVGGDGGFLGYRVLRSRMFRGQVDGSEVIREFDAQVQVLRRAVGERLDHFDSHQNILKLMPRLAMRMIRRGPGMSVRSPARYVVRFQGGRGQVRPFLFGSVQGFRFRRAIADLYLHGLNMGFSKRIGMPSGELHAPSLSKVDLLKSVVEDDLARVSDSRTFEIVCHPAVNLEGLDNSSLVKKRLREYELMRNPRFTESISRIQVVSFRTVISENKKPVDGSP